MKKDKLIVLKDRRLRVIRNNLRIILLEACYRRWKYLTGVSDVLDFKYSISNEKIKNELEILRSLLDNSICRCSSGAGCPNKTYPTGRFDRFDLNMGFSTLYNKWFCEDCFKWIQKNRERLEKELNPHYISNES